MAPDCAMALDSTTPGPWFESSLFPLLAAFIPGR